MLTLPLPFDQPVVLFDYEHYMTCEEWDAADPLSSKHDIYHAVVTRESHPNEPPNYDWATIKVEIQQGADDHEVNVVLLLYPFDDDNPAEIWCDLSIASVNGTDGMGAAEMIEGLKDAIEYAKAALKPYTIIE